MAKTKQKISILDIIPIILIMIFVLSVLLWGFNTLSKKEENLENIKKSKELSYFQYYE